MPIVSKDSVILFYRIGSARSSVAMKLTFDFFPFFVSVVISRDPADPNKTRVAILAHANPGGGIPQWVSATMNTT